MAAKITPDALKEAKEKIELIRKRILDKEITFTEAARTISDEKETRANGGTLINPKTQDTHFELTKMDPEFYAQVSNMNNGDISPVILDEDPKAGKRYKIITVTNKIEQHIADFSKDYTKIKDLALKEKQINAIAKWSETKIKETYIKINGEYSNCEYANNWLKK
jgi:peptidyl-prolyl cis-trans isomerase SurA